MNKQKSLATLVAAALMLLAAMAWGQGSYKAVAGGPPDAPQIPASMKSLLSSQSDSLVNAQGATVCQIWWRKDIPEDNKNPRPDAIYPGFSVGEFMGVLYFPNADTDYRGQSIKAGYYALRYALIPEDGNHMGVSTYPDFLLLIPIADDPNLEQDLAFQPLVKDSRLAANTGHPAVLMLDQAGQRSSVQSPSATQDDQGNWVLNANLSVTKGGQTQQLPFALVLVGQYQGGE